MPRVRSKDGRGERMPTDTKIEIVLELSDGTKIARIENIEDVTTFLEQHVEFVKVVRCKDCKTQQTCNFAQYQGNNGFCSYGEAKMDGGEE